MDNLDNLLNEMQNVASSGNYELDAFETQESIEVENFLVRSGNLPPVKARMMANQIVKSPAALVAVKREMAQNGGVGTFNAGLGQKTVVSSGKVTAMFNINVKREGATINASLPVPIFGYNDIMSAFSDIVDLPSGVTLNAISCGAINIGGSGIADSEKLVIEYRSGGNSDKVIVTCNEVPYPVMLHAMSGNNFELSRIRQKLSDATQQQQFFEKVSLVNRTIFGKKTEDSFTPAQFDDPKNFKDGILDFTGTFLIDKQKTLLTNIIAVNNFSFSLSMFVTTYERF